MWLSSANEQLVLNQRVFHVSQYDIKEYFTRKDYAR